MKFAPLSLSLFVAACAASTPPPRSTPAPTHTDEAPSAHADATPARFDARLSLFDYPFAVQMRRFESQQQPLEMAYMDVRPEGEPTATVLLLHGKNFSGAYWERTARDLVAQGYRVVVPDQIGFGKSSKPTDYQYSFAEMASQTHDLLAELGIERALVVGHSMGGMLATRFSLMFPEETLGLALVNPIGLEDWSRVVPYRRVDEWYARELAKTAEGVRAYMRASYFDGQWAPAYEELAELQMGWTTSPDREQLAMVSALTYDMIFTQPVVHDFEALRVPTLLIIGTRDRTALGKGAVNEALRAELGRYDRLGRAAQAAIPGAELVEIEGVGHIPQVESYERYFAALAAFAGAHTSAAAE